MEDDRRSSPCGGGRKSLKLFTRHDDSTYNIHISISVQVFEFWNLFVMPLTESDYSSHDSMWLYVIGWIVYLFMWSLIIGIAVWQISAQVDYNFSQVSVPTVEFMYKIFTHVLYVKFSND